MALSTDQLVAIRRKVGNTPSDDDLNDIYTRTNDVDELVLEVLETRAANLRLQPDAFSIPGEYSQSGNGQMLKSTEEQIAALGGGSNTVVFHAPPATRPR